MLTLLLAGVLSVACLAFSWRALVRCRSLSSGSAAEEDELEQRLAERAARLSIGLSLRNVQALSRAALAGGTALAFWELTSGTAHHLQAGQAFGAGVVGWAGCRELHRRIGSLADARGRSRSRAPAARGGAAS